MPFGSGADSAIGCELVVFMGSKLNVLEGGHENKQIRTKNASFQTCLDCKISKCGPVARASPDLSFSEPDTFLCTFAVVQIDAD